MALKRPAISETPDADYLMSDEIGLVIAKGMQVLYKTNPKNPVDFLAKYLLNTAKVQRETAAKAKIEEERNAALEMQRLQQLKEEQDRKAKAEAAAEAEKKRTQDFYQRVHNSKDLNDQLQDLNDYLAYHTKATAVYIGRLEQPKKPIQDTDNDRAHIDKNAPAHIRFSHADAQHQFLVD